MVLLFELTWAGVGAILIGVGSALSGYAALKTARTNARREAWEEEKRNVETISSAPDGS
jgi:hypothetical protein